MSTYKFQQFKTEIINPTIEINLNTISDKAIDKLLSVDILLITDACKFGVRAEDMPYSVTWNDSDISNMVDQWLTNYVL
jgi:hypothetical protein